MDRNGMELLRAAQEDEQVHSQSLKTPNENNFQPGILCPAKLLIKGECRTEIFRHARTTEKEVFPAQYFSESCWGMSSTNQKD